MADARETKDEAAQAGLDRAEQVVDRTEAQTTGTSEGALNGQTGNEPE